jgi:glucose-6-phosphate isomerase
MKAHEITESGAIEGYTNRVIRKYSDMKGFYQGKRDDDPIIYEVYERDTEGLNFATTVMNSGKVGDEYFMTKGHLHEKAADEIYVGIRGSGLILLQSNDEFSTFEIKKNKIIYVPKHCAHRCVNTSGENLVFLAIYPADAGHDYGFIERKGFKKIVVERNGEYRLIDNPAYR